MIMAPMPSDSVKKEWPSASRIPRGSSSWKLGRKMKRIASPEPSMVSALKRSIRRIANSTGRKIRLIFSMPPCTPK